VLLTGQLYAKCSTLHDGTCQRLKLKLTSPDQHINKWSSDRNVQQNT